MYSVRLLLRSIARDAPFLEQWLCYSTKSRKNTRKKIVFDLNQSDSLAGIRGHSKAMGYTPEELSEMDDPNDDELNMSVAEHIYDEHLAEVRWKDSKHTLAEYGQKYYKRPQEPAMLTWDDMEQIRQLHSDNKWPISALAKSFPANEWIIDKVCKSSWRPSIQQRFKHDEKVAENWILLRKGKLEMSDALMKHCLKFTNRVARPPSSKELAAVTTEKLKQSGPFLNLIKPPTVENNISIEQTSNKLERRDHRAKEKSEGEEETDKEDESTIHYSESKHILKHLRQKMTLEQARKAELDIVADKGLINDDAKSFIYGSSPPRNSVSEDSQRDKDDFSNSKSYTEQSVATKSMTNEFITKWDSSGTGAKARKDAMMAPVDTFPEKITIPDTAKKPGAIYRLEDCFYDENGEFMYRVPGLKL